MPEWEPVQDENATGLSLRWRKESGGYEFRIFYQEDLVLEVPEEIRGFSWILVIRTVPKGGKSEYVVWSPYREEGSAKDGADRWESDNI